MSELEREIVAVKRELKDLQEEAEKYNSPENYAKYGKLQRQIVQKEKVLKLLEQENKQEKQAKAEKQRAEMDKMSEEQKNKLHQEQMMKEQEKMKQQFGQKVQVDQLRVILTLVYLFVFYVVPILILPSMLPINRSLFKSFARES